VASVLMYCTAACPFCQSAEQLLLRKGARIDKVRVDLEPARRAEMTQKSGGRRTVPQIWIDSRHVGGCDDLYTLEREGRLDPLLEGKS
jgi:glutaredoxin 3